MKKILCIIISMIAIMSTFCISVFAQTPTTTVMNDVTSKTYDLTNQVGFILYKESGNDVVNAYPLLKVGNGQTKDYILDNTEIIFFDFDKVVTQISIPNLNSAVRFGSSSASGIYKDFDYSFYPSLENYGNVRLSNFIDKNTITVNIKLYVDSDNLLHCFNLDTSTDGIFENVWDSKPLYFLQYEDISDIPNIKFLGGFVPPQPPNPIEITVSTITDSIIDFIRGLGSAFVLAFENLFMIKFVDADTNVVSYSGINSLGIFCLVFFGIALGYGVIRWITSLFRRNAK